MPPRASVHLSTHVSPRPQEHSSAQHGGHVRRAQVPPVRSGRHNAARESPGAGASPRVVGWVWRRRHEALVVAATPPPCAQVCPPPHCVSAGASTQRDARHQARVGRQRLLCRGVVLYLSTCHTRSRRQPQRTGCHGAMFTCRKRQHQRVRPGSTTTHEAACDRWAPTAPDNRRSLAATGSGDTPASIIASTPSVP